MSNRYGSEYARCIPGTGAAITVNCGFRPKHIRVINISTAGKLEWFEGMAEGSAYKDKDGTAGEAGYTSIITSNGITVSDRSFVIGTDATNAAPTITTTATGSKDSNEITVASASNLVVGQTIYGAGIPAGTKITAISSTTITLDGYLTAAMSNTACGVANLAIFAE